MELFLNLCWISLLLPAWLLWRHRSASLLQRPVSDQSTHKLVFLCSLGCGLILLFPVISASDDLHAMRPEMEESKRAFRHASHCACTIHALTHSSPPVLSGPLFPAPAFDQIAAVHPFTPPTPGIFFASALAPRAPPSRS